MGRKLVMCGGRFAVLLAALALALLAACTSPVAGRTAGDPATGSLALTFAGLPVGPGARTLVPSSTDLPALASYDVVVSRADYASRTATFLSSTGSVAGLEPGGPWTVTVSGKTSGGLVVATGSYSTLTIALPGPTAATVNLAYVAAASGTGNTGGLALTLLFPKSAGVDGVEAWLDGSAMSGLSVVDTVDGEGNSDGNSKVACAASGLASASSQLIINLKKGSVMVLPWSEQVWVYRNITTTKTETIALASFSAAPPAPASLGATLQSNGTVNLLWPNVGTAESYKVERSEDGGAYASVVSAAAAATAGSDTISAMADRTYRYRISAVNSFGSSGFTQNASAVVVTSGKSGITVSLPAGPSAASLVFKNAASTVISSFTVKSDSTVAISAASGATSYAWNVDDATTPVSTGSSCTIDGSQYVAGPHSLHLDLLSGGRSYSGSLDFTVTLPALSPTTASVTFDSQGGSAVTGQAVAISSLASLPGPNPSKAGSSFGGWYRETGCTTAWAFSSGTVTANMTLYAKWLPFANRYWNRIASSSDGTKLAAVETGGKIWTSADSGANWTARETNRDWYCIASSSDGTKLAAGVSTGYIYTSTDSGETWTERASSLPWYGIASSSDGTKLAAVANKGKIWTSTDSGATWTARGPSGPDWRSISSSDDGKKLATVIYNGEIWASTDSGANWNTRSSSYYYRDVAVSGDGKALCTAADNRKIYFSLDWGTNWYPGNEIRAWRAVASSGDGKKLVAGVYGGQLYTSTDSGWNWTARATSRNWMGLASSSDGTKLAAFEYNGLIYTSTDSGATWTSCF